MPGHNEWLEVARTATADDLREHILTGFKSGKPFTPYVPTIALPSPVDWVLDFGCGVGRNFPCVRTIGGHVAGFDLPPMIARCRELAQPVDLLSDDWSSLKNRRFDLIFASLVLQHIEVDVVRAYLADFARMAPVTYLLTRDSSDFGVNVLDLVSESEAFDAGDCTAVDHDPETHQLRVLGRMSFEQARQSTEPAHYEVLLRSR
ncbi:MAG TPA: class I SAM-dependent methyltransferase [Vicinamibacterales bacterium]|jgi:SAM-dependent methyltransferase|nr:class I SAM-dependent methyltransferase [Acidobacteriota bacterium]HQX80873.1 class I SAM-dependent methyltransferase [Vicinamibacterales bacterium]